MKRRDLFKTAAIAGVMMAAGIVGQAARAADTIKVGILHSLSGTMAISETTLKDTALMAGGHAGTWDHVTGDTTILMIPGAGHFVQHDAEALVNRTIKDWLDQRR